ncbi:hypothetical protein [Mesorhizobium australafricanum]|uniref:HEPN domain-containing protein n=1 Tax=Mesorhizobium australafricanum TaxID=3072311 RepID=A0ABU4X0K8_9HYPH|nr:hypothetical protein [Mesorhizobium sp. VK3E]MDX8441853.1 hypothetical protein [Mesorhizobium sp. VK3E]
MTRGEWRRRADAFARSASTLLLNAHHDTAYHLAGIAVECALKAKIATRFKANDIPDNALVSKIYDRGHKLEQLVILAKLDAEILREQSASADFRANWETVKTWDISSRYKAWSQAEASEMVDAVTRLRTGVLAWIKRHW